MVERGWAHFFLSWRYSDAREWWHIHYIYLFLYIICNRKKACEEGRNQRLKEQTRYSCWHTVIAKHRERRGKGKARWRYIAAGDGGRRGHLKALQVMAGTGGRRDFNSGAFPRNLMSHKMNENPKHTESLFHLTHWPKNRSLKGDRWSWGATGSSLSSPSPNKHLSKWKQLYFSPAMSLAGRWSMDLLTHMGSDLWAGDASNQRQDMSLGQNW